MQQFKIRQDGFKEIRKQMLARALPLMLIAVTAGVYIGGISTKDRATDVNILLLVIPFIVLVAGFGIYGGMRRIKSLFECYTYHYG